MAPRAIAIGRFPYRTSPNSSPRVRKAGRTIVVPEREIRPGIRIAIVEDPDGNWVEFLQRPDDDRMQSGASNSRRWRNCRIALNENVHAQWRDAGSPVLPRDLGRMRGAARPFRLEMVETPEHRSRAGQTRDRRHLALRAVGADPRRIDRLRAGSTPIVVAAFDASARSPRRATSATRSRRWPAAVLAQRGFPVAAFVDVMAALPIDLDELYRIYIGKNVLNNFRQANGYKPAPTSRCGRAAKTTSTSSNSLGHWTTRRARSSTNCIGRSNRATSPARARKSRASRRRSRRIAPDPTPSNRRAHARCRARRGQRARADSGRCRC